MRAWTEGDPPQLKARLTHTVDLAEDEPESATVSSAEQIHEEVGRWLAALRAAPAR